MSDRLSSYVHGDYAEPAGSENYELSFAGTQRQQLKHSLTSLIAEDKLAYPEIWAKWEKERQK